MKSLTAIYFDRFGLVRFGFVLLFLGFVRMPNGLYERFEETVFNTVFEMERVKKALLDVGWKNVYFARIQDLKTPSSHLIHSNPTHTELKSDQKQISPSVSFS